MFSAYVQCRWDIPCLHISLEASQICFLGWIQHPVYGSAQQILGEVYFCCIILVFRHRWKARCFAAFDFSSSVSPCIIVESTLCSFSKICWSVSFGSSGNSLIIKHWSNPLVSIFVICLFMQFCSTVNCCTFRFSLRFSSFSPWISALCDYTVVLFCTAVHSDVCITCRVSFMEVSMVHLMLLFSHSSSSDISLSLLLVIFSDSRSSIFLISSNIFMAFDSTWMFDIVWVISIIFVSWESSVLWISVRSGSEFRLLLTEWFSPVSLLLFLLLPLMLRTLWPWISLIFQLFLGSDIFQANEGSHDWPEQRLLQGYAV